MAERYYFFNSTANDRRRHQASDMADYWESFLSTGLIHQDGKPKLEVTANDTNRNIKVDVGRAVIMGHLYINDGSLTHMIDDPDSVLDRIDRIVLRYDNSIENRYIKSFVLKGVEAVYPDPPELTREGDIYEISLAQIRVVAGQSYISQDDITDERLDESVCGLVSSLVSVPTDIFTAEWKEFVAEYNKWFADIQDSSYATVGDVRESENNMKREIANLNLQIEANKRVKNGVTFGTNFADSFGMEIDMARTSSDEALEVGKTVINVRDAEGFIVGTEVTIYDDINLERVKIASINGNEITLETALTKDYKEGVNVARSMLDIKERLGFAEFGQWGKKEYVDVTGKETPFHDGNRSRWNTFCRVFDAWFVVSYAKIMRLYDGDDTWEEFADVEVIGTYIFSVAGHLVVVEGNSSSLLVQTYKVDGTLVDSRQYIGEFRGVGANRDREKINILSYRGKIFIQISIYSSGQIMEDIHVELTGKEKTYYTSSNNYNTNFGVISDRIVVGYGDNPTDGLRYGIDVYDLSGSLVKENYQIHQTSMNINSEVKGLPFIYVDGKYITCFNAGNVTRVVESTDLIDWKVSTLTGISSLYYMNLIDNNKALMMHSSFNRVASVDLLTNEVTELYNYPVSLSGRVFADITGNEIEVHYSVKTEEFMQGKGFVGIGKDITTNDIRFKTKESKEVVTWLQHDEGLTVTEATFGNINLDLSLTDDETQAVGYTTKEQDEVRLTIERQSVDADVKAYRILGGVS